MKKSRLPEEEDEGESRQEVKEEDEDDEDALKKARDFDEFKDGWWTFDCMIELHVCDWTSLSPTPPHREQERLGE